MALNVVLVSQKQSGKGIFLSWNAMEGVASYLVFVATRKLTPDELEAALAKGGTEECAVVKLGAEATSIVDDCSAEGEPHFYGVAMNFSDGAPRSARFRAVPDGAPAGAATLSSKGMKKSAPRPAAPGPAAATAASAAPSAASPAVPAPAARPAAAAAPSATASASGAARASGASASPTGNTGSYRVGTPAAPAAASANPSLARPAASPAVGASPAGNTGAYRINSGAAAAAPATSAARSAPEEDLLEAQKRAQREARAKLGEASPASSTAARSNGAIESAPAPVPASRAAPEEDSLEAQKRAQREARAKREAESAAPVPAPAREERPAPPAEDRAAARAEEKPAARAEEKPAARAEETPAEDPMEARKRAQAAARAARDASPVSSEPVASPAEFPLEESFDFHMRGGTQTWDGLRLTWEREPRAAAYEILVSDHQIFGDELADALAGKADFTSCTAVSPSVTAVIDNITPRDARGWYLVLVRGRDGKRTPHPFQIGDAAQSGKAVAPFVNPNRTGELRAEVEGMLGDAREQWERWKTEQDGGAKREARRLVQDALLIFPNHPGATSMLSELG